MKINLINENKPRIDAQIIELIKQNIHLINKSIVETKLLSHNKIQIKY